MLDPIKNLYNAEALPGEFLLKPLKTYHIFFAKKIEDSSGLKRVALQVANAVTGIFAYPIFGLLAGVGLLIKLTGIKDVKKHNESEKIHIASVEAGIKYTESYAKDSTHTIVQSGWQMKVAREFKVTKQNVDELTKTINKEIDTLSSQFKKIYVSSNGYINNGNGEITVQLRIQERE